MKRQCRAAAYLRVSTGGQNLSSQRDAVVRAAQARGDAIGAAGWFTEKASSAKLDRPALNRLRAAVRAGEVTRVYVFRIDRLSRSGIRDTLEVVQDFKRCGCELVSVADGFDLTGPAADVVLAVLAWAAQMERAAIGERIKAAHRKVKESGGQWGRRKRLDRAALQKARKLQGEGKSLRQIAQAVKVPRSTLADGLARGNRSG